MSEIYGYSRVSTKKQDPERQARNINAAVAPGELKRIYFDTYTGFKLDGRKEWSKLMKIVKPGDTIIFDSVSRMSRSEDEGVAEYMHLYDLGVNLRFLKEPHIDTDVYRNALTQNQVPLTGTDVDLILEGVNAYLKNLAEVQIRLAFRQAEKELQDLRQRTREGILTAKLKGKTPGRAPGKYISAKKKNSKPIILELSKTFGGNMTDIDLIKFLGISRRSFYTYKKELILEVFGNDTEEDGTAIRSEDITEITVADTTPAIT